MGNIGRHQGLPNGNIWLRILRAAIEFENRLVNPGMSVLLLLQAHPPLVPMGKRFPAYTEHSDPILGATGLRRWSPEPKGEQLPCSLIREALVTAVPGLRE